jgi:high-affinity iron transporter
MTGLFWQIAFVVGRESTEALLVIGILNVWLGHHVDRKAAMTGRRRLFLGIAAGLVGSMLLAGALLGFTALLEGEREDWFQIAEAVVAALLIVQMAVWMQVHGPGMKRELERGATQALREGNWWGLFLLAAIAVMREGSETVVFLYGIVAATGRIHPLMGLAAAATGLAGAGVLYWLLQFGARRLAWEAFFRITQALLLALGAALLMTALDRAIGLDLVPTLTHPLWDTSWLLDDARGMGGLLAALAGYRARPELMPVLVYAGYWAAVATLLGMGRRRRPVAADLP